MSHLLCHRSFRTIGAECWPVAAHFLQEHSISITGSHARVRVLSAFFVVSTHAYFFYSWLLLSYMSTVQYALYPVISPRFYGRRGRGPSPLQYHYTTCNRLVTHFRTWTFVMVVNSDLVASGPSHYFALAICDNHDRLVSRHLKDEPQRVLPYAFVLHLLKSINVSNSSCFVRPRHVACMLEKAVEERHWPR